MSALRSPLGLHLPSLLIGLIPGSLWLFGNLNAPQTSSDSLSSGPLAWRQIVRIEENFPYTVPDSSSFVLSGCGYTTRGGVVSAATPTTPLQVDIDGQVRLLLDPIDGPSSIHPGWVVPAKGRVSVRFGDDDTVGYLFGYLVEN
jgi:hypothetical protein